MIKELFPSAKKVGILFCSSEANSVYQVEEMEKYLASLSIETERFSFTDTNDVASVAQKAADSSDVIYIPTDNTAASNTEAIANVVIPAKVPVVAGEEGICQFLFSSWLNVWFTRCNRAIAWRAKLSAVSAIT